MYPLQEKIALLQREALVSGVSGVRKVRIIIIIGGELAD